MKPQPRVDRRSLMTGVLGASAAGLVAGMPLAAAEAKASTEKGGAIHKVVDVSVRLFKWPVKPGKDHTGFVRNPEVELAVVTIKTDQGAEGHSFLGAHRMSGDRWGADLLQFLKPVVMGQNALDLRPAVAEPLQPVGLPHVPRARRGRHRAVGPRRPRHGTTDPSPASAPRATRRWPTPARRPTRPSSSTSRRRSSTSRWVGRATRSIRARTPGRTSRSAPRCARRWDRR